MVVGQVKGKCRGNDNSKSTILYTIHSYVLFLQKV